MSNTQSSIKIPTVVGSDGRRVTDAMGAYRLVRAQTPLGTDYSLDTILKKELEPGKHVRFKY